MPLKSGAESRLSFLVLIPVLLALTFAADIAFPLGIAVWLAYLVPTVIAYGSAHRTLPVYAAVLATTLIAAGFLLSPAGEEPSIAALNRAMATVVNFILAGIGVLFITYRAENRRQQKLRETEAALAQATAGELSVEHMAAAALGVMAETFGPIAALAYVRDGQSFRRVASIGVPEAAEIPETLAADDGLLRDAIRQRGTLTIDRVPDGYIAFGSGLGSAPVRRLVIGTAGTDDTVNAVFEFGFIGEDQTSARNLAEFLGLAFSSLGVSFRSGKYREHLRSLLSETQQQAEELQAQSEELRGSNDELEAQAKLLLQSQAQLEVQQAELERSNAQLEEQTSSLEAQRDELARAQGSLKAQASELEQASRYKSEFLANMSHELRTPLNSLLIMARLLAENRQGNLSGEQVRFAETIETSGNDLLTLINDILDISKIEAGKLELQIRPAPLGDLLDKLANIFGPAASDKGIGFEVTRGEGLPDRLETDPGRLEQVLRNFLSNAIKFTEHGKVELRAERDQDGRIAFAVRDTGPGIPKEQQQSIFEAFRQADGGISRKYGGTGLGLAISRELASLLGGEIALSSTVGEGSIFTIRLSETYVGPAADSVQDSEAPHPSATMLMQQARPARTGRLAQDIVDDDRASLSGSGRTILVVEDDPAFARILCDIAHELRFQCLIAGTADEGALLARQYLPQAVILDMHLPDHTGLSVLDRIKRDPRTRHIPVHIVSADHDTRAAMAGGAMGYLLKPVSREALIDMLEGLEARMEQRLRRVLVVEDDANQAESIRHLLASRDVETVEAHSAAECLAMLGSQTFDCMVLDLNLPDRGGLDLLEQLSRDENVGFPPVIVYTGRDLSGDEEMRLRRYSKSIIVKGAKSPERLLDEVTLFLHQVVSDLPDEQQNLIARSLERDAALENRHVLVVEDDVRNIYALTAILEPHGVNVRIARNGREAIEALEAAANGAGTPVELVLMDIMMPEMDGLTAMREIRSRPGFANLPIIALTAKAAERDHQECLDAGANDYLAKPLDIDKLLSLVRVWMPR